MRTLLLILASLLLTTPALADDALPPYHPRFGRTQPVIAVVAENGMTELVDLLVPFSVLSRAQVGEVITLSTQPGPVQLMPALRMRAQATVDAFEQRYPDGADYLIVPAVHHSDDPRLTRFVAEQAARGATVVGICDGVLVLGQAGLLDGRRATGHWYSRDERQADYPRTQWQEDRRYLADGNLVTTSGVSAALPASLALVAAIAGDEKAHAVGREIGVERWSAEHHSLGFALGTRGYLTAAGNWLLPWRQETLAVTLAPGMDEATLALQVDAWARTFRTRVVGSASTPVTSLHGLELLPDAAEAEDTVELPAPQALPGAVLDEALQAIDARYGSATADLVAAQLEYPYKPLRAP